MMTTLLPPSPSCQDRTLLQRHTTTDRHLTSILNRSPSLRTAKQVHAFLIRHPQIAACHSFTSLIRLYSNSGLLSYARQVFDQMPQPDVVAWTAILMAYSQCIKPHAIDTKMQFLCRMLYTGVMPNPHTITVVLKYANVEQGKQIHGYAAKNGWDSDKFVGCCLIDFYANSRNLRDTQLVFDRIQNKDVVCYNALISYFGRLGSMEGLMLMFNEMNSADLVPNESTFVGLLNFCATVGFIGPSKMFHAQCVSRGFYLSEVIQGIVVDMYSKCGDLECARRMFDQMMPMTSVVAWNSMIGGYGKHGCVEEAFELFDSMRLSLVSPDHITFTLLLSACSHSGLVTKASELFTMMKEVYRITARNEHYCCIVDLLGRAGMIKEVYELMKMSEEDFGASVWGSLLASCREWGDVEIAELAARRLFEIEPECSGSYVALASTFAREGRWKDAASVRGLMDESGVRKDAGCSWIEVGGLRKEFRAGERFKRNDMEEVYSICNQLNSSIWESSLIMQGLDIVVE